MTTTNIVTCYGPVITQDDLPVGTIWCNSHLHLVKPGEKNKHDIVLDTDHPEYGLLATLQYPSDSYPFVVIGGSKSGKTLYFAPVEPPSHSGNRDTIDREYALARCDPQRARILRRSSKGPLLYGDNMFIGSAVYYRSREL